MLVLFLSTGVFAQQSADKSNGWEFGASIYGWFPDIAGTTAFSPPGSDSEFEIKFEDIVENLEFALMGAFDVRKGSWGVVTDAIYMNIANSESASMNGSIGPNSTPTEVTADVSLDMVSWVWNLAAYYRALALNGTTFDILAGTRYLDVDQKIKWDMTGNVNDVPVAERSGEAKVGMTNWDAIFGVRGRIGLGAKKALFIPYYLDLGVGESDFTWQGIAGLGYAFGWGDIVAAWRYLYYDMSSGSAIDDIRFSGPAVGATFRW
jgi:hypothetical protein